VGGFAVVGLVYRVEVLESVLGDPPSGMGCEQPVQSLADSGEVVNSAQQGPTGLLNPVGKRPRGELAAFVSVDDRSQERLAVADLHT